MNASLTRLVIGIGIVIFGGALLLSNIGAFDFAGILENWWPLVIIALGVLMFVNDPRHYLWSLLVTLFGVLLLLNQLDIIDTNPWQLVWPVAVILIGLSLIMKRPAAPAAGSVGARDDVTAILGGSDRRANDVYEGGKVTALLGGVKLDLRKATIKKDITIETFAFWGGIELILPRDVVVKNQTSAILGGVEDKTEQAPAKNAPVVYVTGDVIMGGVEIKN